MKTKVTQKPPILEIVEDRDKREIWVGKWKAADIYYNRPNAEKDDRLKNKILEANGRERIQAISENTAEASRRYHYEMMVNLGPQFYKRLRAAMCDMWITPIEEKLDRYCFFSTGFRHYYPTIQIRRMWNHLEMVEQMEKDGLHHIIPLAVFFCAPPAKLKKMLGKSIWKKLAHNSIGRNKLIVELMLLHLEEKKRKREKCSPKTIRIYRDYLAVVVSVKTTLLRMYRTWTKQERENYQMLLWVNQYARVTKKGEVYDMTHLYDDTARMASQLNIEIKDWSPKKMLSKHNRMAKDITALRYPDKPFSQLPIINDGVYKNIKYRLMKSPCEVAMEGAEMKHCVASYIQSIEEGKYAVFSLNNQDSGIRSTLGIVWHDGCYRKDQHYGKYNAHITDPLLLEAVDWLEEALNQQSSDFMRLLGTAA